MDKSLDLNNFHEMTDGDSELEQALFAEFITSCNSGIETLRQCLAARDSEKWARTVHALKGISLNLGAIRLGELLKTAQTTGGSEKSLGAIISEFDLVRNYLKSMGTAQAGSEGVR
jgi:HPt (histidine-containing phosphotransfer) domain-containing protein